MKATKSNRAGGGHCGSSRDKKDREGVPGQGAELRKRCPEKGNTTTSWRCAPRFLFPPGRTWRRQAQPDASSLEMATNRSRDRRTCKAAEPHVCLSSGKPLRQAFPSRQCCQCHLRSQVPGKQPRALLPGGRTACLAHQLVPRDCAEEGVRLQLCYAASSRAQASFGIVLQELQRKAMGQEDGEMGTRDGTQAGPCLSPTSSAILPPIHLSPSPQ